MGLRPLMVVKVSVVYVDTPNSPSRGWSSRTRTSYWTTAAPQVGASHSTSAMMSSPLTLGVTMMVVASTAQGVVLFWPGTVGGLDWPGAFSGGPVLSATRTEESRVGKMCSVGVIFGGSGNQKK